MKLSIVKKVALMVLAIAIIVAPEMHGLFGCDDDDDSAVTATGSGERAGQTAASGEQDHHHHDLPGGACCELAVALGAFARASGWARAATGTDSQAFLSPIVAVGLAVVGDFLKIDVFRAQSHPPPSVVPIFLVVHSFLI